ncbi:sulfatase-like hydrolase/transferase [Alphaproteobacteria bacterium]|nr:sulfatase-like hydrolase/transferase [Alphaproteobacteria bacterium]
MTKPENKKPKNILWIMADQLRWDYLSCYGHPHLHTPNIDKLAENGVRFNRAYVNSPVCGAARMSYYTGRYCRSHGATWNYFPLRIGEKGLGDYMKPLGVRTVLVGKTHMSADTEGMEWLGIDPASDIGVSHSQVGFEPFVRDDGLHPTSKGSDSDYDQYLRSHGFDSTNPWADWANSAEDDDGELLSGWLIKNNTAAARVPDEHSETAFMTNQAMEFMETADPDKPWICHLSYIKPHWPYIVPAPYHDMYPPETWLPVNRSEDEKNNAQPVFDAYMKSRICRAFAQDKVRNSMIGAYMGLIKQIDDHLGRLFKHMEERGLADDTMIIMSSDHGDYLGDHWMGEKDLFHDCSVKVPLIVYDPSSEADATRGKVSDVLVEGIDLIPTFIDYYGGKQHPHVLEGKSLAPILAGEAENLRDYVISEFDYVTREARVTLDVSVEDARLVMCADKRWKYVHAESFRPMLFDLVNDPNELKDLGDSSDAEHVAVRRLMFERISSWALQHHNRTTMTHDKLEAMAAWEPPGLSIGVYDEEDYEQTWGHLYSERP